jgi:hypothetical protein
MAYHGESEEVGAGYLKVGLVPAQMCMVGSRFSSRESVTPQKEQHSFADLLSLPPLILVIWASKFVFPPERSLHAPLPPLMTPAKVALEFAEQPWPQWQGQVTIAVRNLR